jgi:hypothetical protein
MSGSFTFEADERQEPKMGSKWTTTTASRVQVLACILD